MKTRTELESSRWLLKANWQLKRIYSKGYFKSLKILSYHELGMSLCSCHYYSFFYFLLLKAIWLIFNFIPIFVGIDCLKALICFPFNFLCFLATLRNQRNFGIGLLIRNFLLFDEIKIYFLKDFAFLIFYFHSIVLRINLFLRILIVCWMRN